MDLLLQRQAVAKSLRDLESTLERFIDALAHESVVITLETGGANELRRACDAFAAINYSLNDRPAETVQCVGAIGVSAILRRRAESLNAAKAALKTVCAPLQAVNVRVPTKGEDSPTKVIPAIRAILRSLQRSDLNLLAAYRKIPVLEVAPASITYTRAMTRSVYRKHVEEIHTLLSTAEGPRASADRAALHTLDPRETHVALVKERYQNTRANVVNTRLDARGRGRIQIAAELPILYVPGRHPPPEIRFASPDTFTRAVQRSRQRKLEPRAFLQTLPVYRYLAQ